MSPEEIRELLPLYVLNALPPGERERLERALDAHPELWGEVRALREVVAALLEGEQAPAPVGHEARLMARIRREKYRRRWPSHLGRAAAVIALLLGGYGLLWTGGWLLALGRPDTQVFALERPSGGVVGRVILRPDRTALVILPSSPPPGRVYQAWGVRVDGLTPLPTFRFPLKTLRLPPEARAVAISLEPPGGSSKPTQVLGLPR